MPGENSASDHFWNSLHAQKSVTALSDQDLLEFPDSSHRKQPASPVSDSNQMHDIVMQSIEDGAMLNELISIQDSASEELSIIKPLFNDECDE